MLVLHFLLARKKLNTRWQVVAFTNLYKIPDIICYFSFLWYDKLRQKKYWRFNGLLAFRNSNNLLTYHFMSSWWMYVVPPMLQFSPKSFLFVPLLLLSIKRFLSKYLPLFFLLFLKFVKLSLTTLQMKSIYLQILFV